MEENKGRARLGKQRKHIGSFVTYCSRRTNVLQCRAHLKWGKI